MISSRCCWQVFGSSPLPRDTNNNNSNNDNNNNTNNKNNTNSSIDAQGVPMSSIKPSGVHDETMQGKSQRHNKISSASKSADARAQIGCTGDLRTSLPSNDLSGEGQNFWPNKNGNINCSGASPFQSNVDVKRPVVEFQRRNCNHCQLASLHRRRHEHLLDPPEWQVTQV